MSRSDITRGTSDKDLRKLMRHAMRHGWRLELRRNNHMMWVPPNGAEVYFTSMTPSDWRAVRNARAALRARGLPDMRD